MILKIGSLDISDLLKSYKIEYNVLLSDKSGRNAKGNATLDIINRKVKIYASIIPLSADTAESFLAAIEPFVVTVQYLDTKTQTIKTATCYCNTPSFDYLFIRANKTILNSTDINFIEL